MPTSFVLNAERVFENVPVTSTLRGFAVPFPAILRIQATSGKPNPKDKEWDGRSASLSFNRTVKTHYLAKILHKPVGKAGFTRSFLSVQEVDIPTWNRARDEWATFLINNAEDFTSTHATVIENLRGRVPRSVLTGARPGSAGNTVSNTQGANVPNPPATAPVPTPVAVAVQNVTAPTWDPDDLDIAHDLFEVPMDNPNFMPDRETFEILDAAWKRAIAINGPVMVLIYGDTSTGKTEHPIIWAARNGQLHCRIDCGAFGEIYDVTGPIKAKESNGVSVTEWIKGKTIRAMADPRPAVIQLDEVNRISDVKAMNILFPFFDIARKSYFDDNQTWMHLQGAKVIVSTMNGDTRGDDIGEYVGTQPLDQAFISRFPIRRQLRYPDATKLAQILTARSNGTIGQPLIDTVAQIAVELVALNKFVPNLRELFAALDFLADGKDLFHALKWTVGGIYKDDGTSGSDYISFKAVLNGKGINTDES
jgi:MoxR-like ATPase